jgi:lipopolysaccharide biosynthesis protein
MVNQDLKAIALYLPQFHPVPENDEWWGKGFTEWTNVAKSKPKFAGHYQPHIPADMGFYDLRLLQTLVDQAKLAMQYGISGFCFYHYWFNGKLLLETPIEQMLKAGQPDFPFCLCWANENWTRRWDGEDKEVLIEQNYDLRDDLDHIRYLIPFFKDDRYIKINNKPVFIMYRSELHPDVNAATEIWRQEVKKAGFEDLYLIRVENFDQDIEPSSHGFDASMEFAPDFSLDLKKYSKKNILKHLAKKSLKTFNIKNDGLIDNRVFSYRDLVSSMLDKPLKPYKRFRCVCPCWDNSARRSKQATIFVESSPHLFKKWLMEIKKRTLANFKDEERIIFINAWNEWAEGCHLEPDLKFGRQYLEAVVSVMYEAHEEDA